MSLQESIKLEYYIIWGAGRIAEDFYNRYVKKAGRIIPYPLYWVDRDESKIGTFIDGVKVISPDEMIKFLNKRENKKISLVIGVAGNAFLSVVNECNLLGFDKVYSAQQLDAI